MRILIADDEKICFQVLAAQLALLGDCDHAADGAATVRMVGEAYDQGRPYGLLLLDILMPGMDGQEVLRRIRSAEEQRGIRGLKGLKIVMTTGMDDRHQVIAAFRGQAEGYLVKPVALPKLREILKDLGVLCSRT